MTYEIILSDEAKRHLEQWRLSGKKKTAKKILSLFQELTEHPTTGTGQVEQLRGDLSGYWSRRIDKENRLIYAIDDDVVTVTVVSAKGHYGNK